MEIKEGKAYQYAKWCVEETEGKVPKYVKKQAESWLQIADGEDEEAYVDEKEFQKICKLLKLMNHPDLQCSIYEGMEDYAWLLITAALCTYMKNTERRTRFYTTVLLEIARKNFKTFNSAVIFILLMLTEPNFSRFFSVAPDLTLSSELKNAIRKIIKTSPALYDDLDPAFKILRSQIECLLNDNVYTPLAYSQDRMDGKLANAFLADEAGALDEYPVEAMRSSQITLFNKLGIIISTQYPNDDNVMISEIDAAKKILDGLLDMRRTFSLLYEPDNELQQGDTWMTDDRVIYQSNPVAVTNQNIFENIKEKRAMAILYENKRENFLCKHCNILYKGLGVEGYIDVQKVKPCSREQDDDWWSGRRVWVGMDLSLSDDNTAVAMVTKDDGEIYARLMGFIPEGRVDFKKAKEKVDYRRCVKAGECIACGDEVIDYSEVERYILTMDYPDETNKQMRKFANEFKKDCNAKMPAEYKEGKRPIPKNWEVKNKQVLRVSIDAEIRNKAPHFHLVENGHNMVVRGQTVGFVPGKHYAERTREEWKEDFPDKVKDFVDEMLERRKL